MRKQSDINRIIIHTCVSGWFVRIFYKDGKAADFTIGLGDAKFDMLKETFRCIKLQLASHQKVKK